MQLVVALLSCLPLASALAMVSPPQNVLVAGAGAIQALTARLAALSGYEVTIAVPESAIATAKSLCFDDKFHQEGSIPLKIMCISGDAADSDAIDKVVAETDALIVAFDNDSLYMPEPALNVLSGGSNLKHISVMSRYLNGAGMGFFATAAKTAANQEIWCGDATRIASCKTQEEQIKKKAAEKGASYSIVRAGTLKGGGMADAALEPPGSGESSFLASPFYSMGQQDIVNWRLLFDCSSLGVELSKGDTLPGPGFKAALTATSRGDGDSHRGAVATALVESLRQPKAADADFSVKAVEGDSFPSEAEWAKMFEAM